MGGIDMKCARDCSTMTSNHTLARLSLQCQVGLSKSKPQPRWPFPQICPHTVASSNQQLHFFSQCSLVVLSAIAGRVGLTRATINHVLWRHAATETLVPGKSTGTLRKTTPHQYRVLFRMVPQDRFIIAQALTARIRNLYAMSADQKTIINELLSHGYRAYRPIRKPLLIVNHRHLCLEWVQSGKTWQWPFGSMSYSVTSPDSKFTW